MWLQSLTRRWKESSLNNFFIFFPILLSGGNKNHGMFLTTSVFFPKTFLLRDLGPLFQFISPKLQRLVYGLMKTKKNLGNFAKYLWNPGLRSLQGLSDVSWVDTTCSWVFAMVIWWVLDRVEDVDSSNPCLMSVCSEIQWIQTGCIH